LAPAALVSLIYGLSSITSATNSFAFPAALSLILSIMPTCKRAVGPSYRIGFHGINLIALHAAHLRFAGSVSNRHHQLVAIRAAFIVHDFLPTFRTNLAQKFRNGSSRFNKKHW
jgi:hypothetical protein